MNKRNVFIVGVIILFLLLGLAFSMITWLLGGTHVWTGFVNQSEQPVGAGISFTEASQLRPWHPYELSAKLASGAVVLQWPGTGSDTIRYYEIYFKTPNDTGWQPLRKWGIGVRVKPVGDNTGDYEYIDESIKPGETFVYGVAAVNYYGKKSNITQSKAITR